VINDDAVANPILANDLAVTFDAQLESHSLSDLHFISFPSSIAFRDKRPPDLSR